MLRAFRGVKGKNMKLEYLSLLLLVLISSSSAWILGGVLRFQGPASFGIIRFFFWFFLS